MYLPRAYQIESEKSVTKLLYKLKLEIIKAWKKCMAARNVKEEMDSRDNVGFIMKRRWWGRLIVKNDWYFILEQYEIPMTLTEIRIKGKENLRGWKNWTANLILKRWYLNQRYFIFYPSPLWNPNHLCHTEELVGRMQVMEGVSKTLLEWRGIGPGETPTGCSRVLRVWGLEYYASWRVNLSHP